MRRRSFSCDGAIATALVLVLIIAFSPATTLAQSWALELVAGGGVSKQTLTHDGQLLLGGGIGAPTPYEDDLSETRTRIWLTKMDVSGRIIWSRMYRAGMDNSLGDIAVAQDGNIYAAAIISRPYLSVSSGWLLKLSPNGDILWSRLFEHDLDIQPFQVVPHPDGGAFVLGVLDRHRMGNQQIFLFRVDSSGNPLLQKRFHTSGYYDPTALTWLEDNSIVFGANSIWPNDPALFFRMTDGGSVTWKRSLTASWSEIAAFSDAPSGSGSKAVLYLRESWHPTLVQLDNSGQAIQAERYAFPIATDNVTSIHPADLAKNADGGWTISAVDDYDVHHIARLDSNLKPLWLSSFNEETWSMAEVDELFGDQGSGPKYVFSFWSNRINLLNEFGLIDDSDCDLVTQTDLGHSSSNLTFTDAQINVTDFSANTSAIAAEVQEVTPETEFLCRQSIFAVRPGFTGEIVHPAPQIEFFSVPIEIDMRPDIILPRCPHPPLPCDYDPFPIPAARHDNPNCDRCLPFLADGTEFLLNPKYRASLYRTVRPFINASFSAVPLEKIEAFLTALQDVPLGKFFTADVRNALTMKLKDLVAFREKNRASSYVPLEFDPMPLLGYTLNLITLDLVTPDIEAPTIQGDRAIFGTLASVSFASLPKHAEALTLKLHPDMPTSVTGYLPGAPAVFFDLQGAGDIPDDELITVTLYYGGMRFRGSEEDLRLLHWHDGRYSDITIAIDTTRREIIGTAASLGTFTIMQCHPNGKR